MKRNSKILRTILTMTLLVPYFSFALPKVARVEAAGEGNCAVAYYEDLGTEPAGAIVKDETWTDDDSSKVFTVTNDKIISVVFVKSGANELDCQENAITEDGEYSNDHFIVSGIGTNSVTVTENGGQDVSHTEFIVTDASNDYPYTPEECSTISGYKWFDQNGNREWDDNESGLENWEINLDGGIDYEIVETFEVNAKGDVSTSSILEEDTNYIIRAERNEANAGDTIDFDAKYSITNRIVGDTWTDSVSGYESYGDELLDLQIDGLSPDWGEYDENHTYYVSIVGDGYAHDFQIYDIYPSNNSGSITVSILEAGSSSTLTDETGYYEFIVCSVGEYTLEETQQPEYKQTYPEESVHYFTLTEEGNIETESENFDFGNTESESSVTLCKQDEKDNYLSDWNLSLRSQEVADEVDVPSRAEGQNTNAVVSMDLEVGTYVLVANGNYKYGNWSDESGVADAGYSLRTPGQSYSMHDNYYPTWVSGDDLNSVGYLEVRVDNTNVNWGDFNNDHIYELVFEHDGGNLDFTILDSHYTDNEGSINVKAYRLYEGATDSEGCITFEGVEFGNYVIDEVIENPEKWVNVSGLGEIVVSELNQTFTVVNNFIDPADLVIEKSEDNDDNIVEAGDEIAYTIRYANIGEDDAVNVMITETVPAHTTYSGDEGWICDADPAIAGTICTYEAGDLVGQNTTAEEADYGEVTFTVTVDADVEDGDIIDNVATISSDSEEENVDDNEDDADTITVVGGVEGDNDENDDDQGAVAGESTVREEDDDEVLGIDQTNPTQQTFNPEVLGATAEETLAKTGSTVAWVIAGLGAMILIGSSTVLLRRKKK